MRRVELEFNRVVEASIVEGIPGVHEVTIDNHRAAFSFNGEMAVLLRTVAEHYDVVDINTREADLEEIFLTYYRDEPADEGTQNEGTQSEGTQSEGTQNEGTELGVV